MNSTQFSFTLTIDCSTNTTTTAITTTTNFGRHLYNFLNRKIGWFNKKQACVRLCASVLFCV